MPSMVPEEDLKIRNTVLPHLNVELAKLGEAGTSFRLFNRTSMSVKKRFGGAYATNAFFAGTMFVPTGCYLSTKTGRFIYILREANPIGSQWAAVELTEQEEEKLEGFTEAVQAIMLRLTGEDIMPYQVGDMLLRRRLKEAKEAAAARVMVQVKEDQQNELYGTW